MHRESTELDHFIPSYEHMEISRVLYVYFNGSSAPLLRVCAYEHKFW
jgi:hypothetical protein